MSEQRVYIRFSEETDAAELAAMYKRNQEFFDKFSPNNQEKYYTEEYQLQTIIKSKADMMEDRKYSFVKGG